MLKLVLSALIFASAFQTALGDPWGNYDYSVNNGEVTINSYNGSESVIIIPSVIPTINGDLPVTSLGVNSFNVMARPTLPRYSPTKVTIPNGVRLIDINAFAGCFALTEINIPNSVITIGVNAFSACSSLPSINIPNSVTSIDNNAFSFCTSLTSITIPASVTSIGEKAFQGCTGLTSVTMPDRFMAELSYMALGGQASANYLINALANNEAFVTAVANKILAKSGNYGLSVKSELGTLATKSELTSALTESRTAGVNSVLSNPNLWTLYTTSQIQNMAVGDLVLTRQVSGGFVLNYDIEQSTDLQTWTPYQALSLPLTGLPTDKAFVRIKAKQ